MLNMPKLKLCFFTNTESVFLTKVLALRLCRHKKEPEIQLRLEIRKSPKQTAFKLKSGQADGLGKQFCYHLFLLTFTLKCFPVLLNLTGLSSSTFRTLDHYFLLVYLTQKDQKLKCKKGCLLPQPPSQEQTKVCQRRNNMPLYRHSTQPCGSLDDQEHR